MLSYNDAYHQPSQSQSDASCVVCHDLVDSERIIWHEVKIARHELRSDPSLDTHTTTTTVVPICVDCADLFHDVKPSSEENS